MTDQPYDLDELDRLRLEYEELPESDWRKGIREPFYSFALRNAYPALAADIRRLKAENDEAHDYFRDPNDPPNGQIVIGTTLLEKMKALVHDYEVIGDEMFAENRRLQAENDSLKVADIDKIVTNLEVMRLLAENKQMREALERFANDDNYEISESGICREMRDYIWGADMDWPTEVARRALSPATGADEENL